MAKRKRRQNNGLPSNQPGPAPPLPEELPRKFDWIPLWGWILIFLVPLALSEYMFYMVGRMVNLILFPVVWTAFWIVIMQRSGWPILKKRKHK
jgi:hypothetical protein